jgi:PhnB protein
MAERDLPDQLNEAIERLLAGVTPAGTARDPLVQLAADLLDMPRPEFKARLREELERRAKMSATAVTPIPKGYRSVAPYIIAQHCAEMIDFVKQAFGAKELYRGVGSGGGIHAEIQIGDSMLKMGGGLAYQGPARPAALHYYVDESPDEVYERALRLGATSLGEPTDHPYGERGASVRDPFGNDWYIARSLGPRYVPEGMHDITVCFHPIGAPKFIDFLKQTFAAEPLSRHESPDGVVVYATLRIGDSVIETSEAHGPYQPIPTTIYLFVPNVDEVYRTALAAGATSIYEPADQPYGDRNAGVKDAFGYTWYIATHVKDVAM